MKFLLHFVSLLTVFSSIRCNSYLERLNPDCPLGEYPDKCDTDGNGNKPYYCTGAKGYRAYRVGGKRCGRREECQCYIDDESNDYPGQRCSCANTKRFPSFHDYGVIRWHGYDERDYKKVKLSGEVHRDTNGNFLLRGNVENRWSDEFKIIMPDKDGKTFTKFTYTDASKILCKNETVANGGRLDDIWMNTDEFNLKSEKIVGKDSVEVWERTRLWGELRDNTDMAIKYDGKRNRAVPTKYYHNMWDLKNVDIVVNLDYIYESVGYGKSTFRLSDYCSNTN